MNQIITLTIEKKGNCWVFDDPAVGLLQEPFVCGINEILEHWMAEDGVLERALAEGVQLLGSAEEFPGNTHRLVLLRPELGGTWYRAENGTDEGMEGWLCPALNKYFDPSPQQLYAAFV
jgi:hypothetical protein